MAIAGAALAVVGLSYYLWRQVDARTGGESGWFGGGIKGHDGADAEAGQGPDKAGQVSGQRWSTSGGGARQ